MGDAADLVIAFNEQVLWGRIEQGAYRKGTHVILDNKWATDSQDPIRAAYAETLAYLHKEGYVVHEMAMNAECLKHVSDPAKGRNMFVLGMLCRLYGRDMSIAEAEIHTIFARKGDKVLAANLALIRAGFAFAADQLPFAFEIPVRKDAGRTIVCNGNQAIGLGVMAAGMELVSMYPITPATSASHYLAGAFEKVGGVVHQAEDEIAAISFAMGASYAGKTACTITSGPGLALKMEMLGLAVMAEIPLVLVLVQRGGPSTGLPTKVEQGDLLSALYGAPGDAPKVILAAATIEDCFHMTILARKLAEDFRTPVILLTDANLATGVSPMPRPIPQREWLAAPVDQSPWTPGVRAFEWDERTGLSSRPIPGQPGGEWVLTGLAHTREGKVAYDPYSNQIGCDMRSRKLAALQATLKRPDVFGEERGDLLVVSWGSTLGSVQEAVGRLHADGEAVSSIHLRFLSPLEPGLKELFAGFRKVMTIELNYADAADAPLTNPDNQRFGQLATVLRAQTLCDIESYATVPGQPLAPADLYELLKKRLTTRTNGVAITTSDIPGLQA